MNERSHSKPLYWVESSKRDLIALPAEVMDTFGYGLYLTACGSSLRYSCSTFSRTTFGVTTPKARIDLIRERLRVAEE